MLLCRVMRRVRAAAVWAITTAVGFETTPVLACSVVDERRKCDDGRADGRTGRRGEGGDRDGASDGEREGERERKKVNDYA